ncbi:MAG: efflux RND transporter periplasmic adaptor subunit [Flavobacteriales bacterium]
MKNILTYTTIAALLAACGAATPTDDLGRKRAELDSLKASYAATAELIKDVDAWIAEHDSTVKKSLPNITTFALTASRFEHFVQVHGNVKADKSADLFAMAGGRVRRILVSEGDRVHSGQLLVDLDNDAIDKQIAAAESGATLAKDLFEKQSRLWEQKIGSEVQYLSAKSQKDQAEASLAALREQRRMTQVTAPFDGVVDEIMVSQGDMTGARPVARVVDPSGASLEADVPENYISSVKSGDPVKVEFPSLGDTMTAVLSNVSKYIDPANRTFRVSVRMPKNEGLVRPNLLSVIHVRDQVIDSALVVPSRLIQENVEGKSYLFKLEEKDGKNKSTKVYVEPIAIYKGWTVVASGTADGLVGGETLVDEGSKNIADGQEVNVIKL